MPKFELSALHIERPAGLELSWSSPPRDDVDGRRILVVSAVGEYPDGSLGNGHGHAIKHHTMSGYFAFDPDAVVLDFSRLTYRWGNTILGAIQELDQSPTTSSSRMSRHSPLSLSAAPTPSTRWRRCLGNAPLTTSTTASPKPSSEQMPTSLGEERRQLSSKIPLKKRTFSSPRASRTTSASASMYCDRRFSMTASRRWAMPPMSYGGSSAEYVFR